jgi:hypothetical protein
MKNQNGILLEVQNGIDNTPSDVRGNYSDGYHTFNELYEFRKTYNAALFNDWAIENKESVESRKAVKEEGFNVPEFTPRYNVHKSIRHHDGEYCFGGGWFIVVAVLPTGQISNHYELKDWDLFKIPAKDRSLFEFNGHTPHDVMAQLNAL